MSCRNCRWRRLHCETDHTPTVVVWVNCGDQSLGGVTDVMGLLASELRRARERAGLTREQLAEASAFSTSLIEKVECGDKPPSEHFVRVMDDVLKTDGLLTRLRQYALTYDLTPEWLRSWFDVEQQASHILWFDLSFVPGLMQLEDYVRALLDNENKVVARLKRQSVLSKDIDYVALIDERALRNLVGGPEIMAKQLEHVVELANRLIIQVIPINCGIY